MTCTVLHLCPMFDGYATFSATTDRPSQGLLQPSWSRNEGPRLDFNRLLRLTSPVQPPWRFRANTYPSVFNQKRRVLDHRR
ncbi:hypothetical protein AFLA_012611 [Aspergillus flavus NRRL3357]|nr:hypothetical protein AFLA_012611 [Aspergillus flavus NRRL3357]